MSQHQGSPSSLGTQPRPLDFLSHCWVIPNLPKSQLSKGIPSRTFFFQFHVIFCLFFFYLAGCVTELFPAYSQLTVLNTVWLISAFSLITLYCHLTTLHYQRFSQSSPVRSDHRNHPENHKNTCKLPLKGLHIFITDMMTMIYFVI